MNVGSILDASGCRLIPVHPERSYDLFLSPRTVLGSSWLIGGTRLRKGSSLLPLLSLGYELLYYWVAFMGEARDDASPNTTAVRASLKRKALRFTSVNWLQGLSQGS